MDDDRWEKEPRNPHNGRPSTKWKNVALVTFTSWLTVFVPPLLVPANNQIGQYYGEDNRQLVLLATAVFVFAQGAGPFIIGPISELYGRKVAYCFGLTTWIAWTIGCLFAPTLATLTLFRFLSGLSASIGPCLGASSVADHFPQHARGVPLGIYNVGPVLGPVLGPVVGSYLTLTHNFRWIHYTTFILLGIDLFLIIVFLDESYAIVLQRNIMAQDIRMSSMSEAKQQEELARINPSARQVIWQAVSRPPRMLLNPFLVIFSIYYAWVFSLIYLLVVTIPLLFSNNDGTASELFTYGWSSAVFALAYLPIGAGNLTATGVTTLFGDRIYGRLQREHGGEARAEYRLYLAQWGAIVLPAGFLIWGWTAQKQTSPVGPLVGEVVLGLGLQMSYGALQTFIVDASQPFSAAAVAATNVLRNTLAAILLVVGPNIFETLSWGRGGTLVACLSLPILPAPLLMLRYGPFLRKRFPIKP